jgi:hypothetical protein
MRNTFIGFLFLVAIWIGWGAPIPGTVVQPLTPSEKVPTFSQSLQDQAQVESAARAGQLQEDESQRAMRQRIITAARRLEDFPCDKARREELRAASVAFVKERMRRVRSGKDIDEYVNINGRTVNASAHFNREAGDIVEEALFQGVIRPGDLPFGPIGAGQMGQLEKMARFEMGGKPGRFICDMEAPRR